MVVWLGWFLIVTMGSGFSWFWCCLIVVLVVGFLVTMVVG